MEKHLLFKVTAFEHVGDWRLRVHFDDGTIQVIDFLPVLHGSLLLPLRDKSFFARVQIDPDWDTLVWPNGADFDPETLRNWPQYADELKTQLAGGSDRRAGAKGIG